MNLYGCFFQIMPKESSVGGRFFDHENYKPYSRPSTSGVICAPADSTTNNTTSESRAGGINGGNPSVTGSAESKDPVPRPLMPGEIDICITQRSDETFSAEYLSYLEICKNVCSILDYENCQKILSISNCDDFQTYTFGPVNWMFSNFTIQSDQVVGENIDVQASSFIQQNTIMHFKIHAPDFMDGYYLGQEDTSTRTITPCVFTNTEGYTYTFGGAKLSPPNTSRLFNYKYVDSDIKAIRIIGLKPRQNSYYISGEFETDGPFVNQACLQAVDPTSTFYTDRATVYDSIIPQIALGKIIQAKATDAPYSLDEKPDEWAGSRVIPNKQTIDASGFDYPLVRSIMNKVNFEMHDPSEILKGECKGYAGYLIDKTWVKKQPGTSQSVIKIGNKSYNLLNTLFKESFYVKQQTANDPTNVTVHFSPHYPCRNNRPYHKNIQQNFAAGFQETPPSKLVHHFFTLLPKFKDDGSKIKQRVTCLLETEFWIRFHTSHDIVGEISGDKDPVFMRGELTKDINTVRVFYS